MTRQTILQLSSFAAVAAVLGAAPLAKATPFTWSVATPSSSSTWNTIGNWTPGTAVPGAGDQALFGATGVSSANSSINNVVSASTAVAALTYNQNGASAFHVTQILSPQVLTVAGPFTNGEISADGSITPTYFTGSGTLVVSGTPFLNGNYGVSASAALATLDLSGLSTFIYSNASGTFDVGEDGSTLNRPGGLLNLAGTSNNITAGTINLMTLNGGNAGNASSAINFGAGTNVINVGTFNIAGRKSSGSVKFLTTTGGLRLRGANGNVDDTSRASMVLGTVNGKTGTVDPIGRLLLAGAGHPVDIKASTVTVGLANGANGTSMSFGAGIITFDAGTFDATAINMAVCSMTAGAVTSGASGTISVSNNATAGTSGTLIIGSGGMSLANATMFTSTGNLNIYGGTVNSFGNIIKSAGVTATATNVGNIVNSAGTLIMQPNTSVGTPALPLDNFILTNATLHLSVNASSISTNICASNALAVGTSTIVIDNVQNYTGGTVTWPLISYVNTANDPFAGLNSTPTLPAGFSGTLVDDPAKQTVDLQITTGPISVPPVPLTWNGGGAGNNWSDPNNWQGTNLVADDTLFFDGNSQLVNNNDTIAGTLYSNITFNATASSFVLNGNAITLGASGGVTNLSGNPQAVNLGLTFNSNVTLNGGNAGLIIGGALVNNASTGLQTISLAGNGILTNLFSIQFFGTNSFFMTNSANWAIVDNPASSPVTVSNAGFNITGGSTLSFGGTGNAPQLFTLQGGQGQDSLIGDNNSASVFNMNNGTLTLGRRLDTGDANVTISGGTLNLWNQFQVANGVPANVSTVTVTGGTLNVASTSGTTAGGTFYLASRGAGTLTVSGGLVECSTLDISRNAAGATGSSTGIVNLNGGTLQINGAVTNASANFVAGGTPTSTFNFNGGTLKANKTGVVTYQGNVVNSIPITSIVQAGGAIVQTASAKQMIILEPLIHDSTLGSTPDGGLTKNGADLLTLDAANTYSGNTTVNAGILALGSAGSIVSPHIILTANTVFDVSATAGFTLGAGQTLTNSGSTAALNGNVTTGPGTVSLTYGGTPSLTVTNGTLTLSSTTVFTINNTGAALAPGSYEIISTNNDTAGGPNALVAVSDSLPAVTVTGSGVTGGNAVSLSIVNSELLLVVGSSNPFPGPIPTVSVGAGTATLNFTGVPGTSYSLLRSTNLLNWLTIYTTNAPAGGTFNVTDDFSDLGGQQPPTVFYRFRSN